MGELFQAKTEDDAADKKLAAAVQDEMRKKGTAGEAAAKALVAKLQQEKAAAKKKLETATTKVADAVKNVAEKRNVANVAKLAEDKSRGTPSGRRARNSSNPRSETLRSFAAVQIAD